MSIAVSKANEIGTADTVPQEQEDEREKESGSCGMDSIEVIRIDLTSEENGEELHEEERSRLERFKSGLRSRTQFASERLRKWKYRTKIPSVKLLAVFIVALLATVFLGAIVAFYSL